MTATVVPRQFRVRLLYREPTYELHTGNPRERPYRADYEVRAASEAGAIDQAVFEFRATAALSRVGWAREIVDVEVEELKAAG